MKLAYRPEIDGLRAIAVLSVVLYHAGIGHAGFVGVDVFFVISGYLISRLLLDERTATGRIDFAAFYARRVRRIIPASVLVILATLGLCAAFLSQEQQANAATSAGAALTFVANVFFQFHSGGYFDGRSSEMPLLHLWSLSVEEQFYLLWPAIILLAPRRWLRPVLAELAVISLLLAEWWISRESSAAFFEMPARFWELAAGGLIAASAFTAPRWLLPAGIVLTFAASAMPLPHFPGIGALPAVLGASAIIAAVHGGQTNRLLASRPMVGVGLISYSLYLWHWPLLAILRASSVGDNPITVKLAVCGVALLLAIATYRYVEQPFRRMRFAPRKTVLAAAVLCLTLCACAIGLRPDPPPSMTPDRRCHSRVDEPAVPKCEAKGARVGVWGDSLAYAWSPSFPVSFSRDSCPPYLGDLPNDKPTGVRCRDFNALALEQAKQLDTVYLVGYWRGDVSALRPTLDALSGVPHVVIIGSTPEMKDDAPRCVELFIDCGITRTQFEATAQPILAQFRAMARTRPNVSVFDPTDYFCAPTQCPPALKGVTLYWDGHHPTVRAVTAALPPQ